MKLFATHTISLAGAAKRERERENKIGDIFGDVAQSGVTKSGKFQLSVQDRDENERSAAHCAMELTRNQPVPYTAHNVFTSLSIYDQS